MHVQEYESLSQPSLRSIWPVTSVVFVWSRARYMVFVLVRILPEVRRTLRMLGVVATAIDCGKI
ncbi:hypothetical protein XH87_10445 [Bradyrhizobium sp. CCBAU 53415]|nr:hypothetical protein [Bradyrhizobium sp. CCBAU 53415]